MVNMEVAEDGEDAQDSLTDSQTEYVENAVSLFIAAYTARLIASHAPRIFYTVKNELEIIKNVQRDAGEEVTTFRPSDISQWSKAEVEQYKIMLLDYGGSYIVKNGILEFKDWMNSLRSELIVSCEKVIIKSKNLGYTPQKLRQALLNAMGAEYNNRLYVSAYVESRVIEDQTKRELYAETGISYVTWHTQEDNKVRPTHQARNKQVYLLAECPSLGEPGCRCWIYPKTIKNSLMIEAGE
jgi:hypothetical protein